SRPPLLCFRPLIAGRSREHRNRSATRLLFTRPRLRLSSWVAAGSSRELSLLSCGASPRTFLAAIPTTNSTSTSIAVLFEHRNTPVRTALGPKRTSISLRHVLILFFPSAPPLHRRSWPIRFRCSHLRRSVEIFARAFRC